VSGTYILGAGVTGLAAAYASGLTAFEAADQPGGICSSYYVRPDDDRRLTSAPNDDQAYRFEIGGGHWLFGGDPVTLRFIRSLTPMKSYTRRSSVFIPQRGLHIPYPIQNHLRFLHEPEAAAALREILEPDPLRPLPRTMAEWIDQNFGGTLGELFFHPFHRLYTASLWRSIAPQDPYKSPLDRSAVIEGASNEVSPVGYNTTFLYPRAGLNALATKLASTCDIHYGKRVEGVDTDHREIRFSDGSSLGYDTLLTTLPLNRMLELAHLEVDVRQDPHTSVLVINVGAVKGADCPEEHWIYVPRSDAGFHRVGFYSNVDRSFIPESFRDKGSRVSVYVETAFDGGRKPSPDEIELLTKATIAELQAWGWIGEVEVVDPTWIDVAYTWSWPDSRWAAKATAELESRSIYPVGRYARWVFQGIADSIRDGLMAGSSFRGAE
jgi:protoporphyrinogen oxidase